MFVVTSSEVAMAAVCKTRCYPVSSATKSKISDGTKIQCPGDPAWTCQQITKTEIGAKGCQLFGAIQDQGGEKCIEGTYTHDTFENECHPTDQGKCQFGTPVSAPGITAVCAPCP